jgi:hypothetical protein
MLFLHLQVFINARRRMPQLADAFPLSCGPNPRVPQSRQAPPTNFLYMLSISPDGRSKKLDVLLIALAAVFIYLVVFKLPHFAIFHEADHLIFLYDADRMLRGEVIYRDFFQFTFPGTQALYYLIFLVFGPKYMVTSIAVLFTGVVLFAIGLLMSKRVIGGPLAYIPPLIYIFFGFRWFGAEGSHRLFFPVFFYSAIMILMKGRSRALLISAAVACAFASFFTQQRGIVAVMGIILFLFIDASQSSLTIGRTLSDSLLVVAVFLITLALLCMPFAYSAGVDEFIRSTIMHPSQFYGLHPDNTPAVFFAELRRALQIDAPGKIISAAAAMLYGIIAPLTHLAFLAYFARRRRHHDWSFWREPTLLAVMGTVMLIGSAAPMHVRFFNTSMPSLILLVWLAARIDPVRRYHRRVALAFATVLITAGFVPVVRLQARADVRIEQLPAGPVAVVQPNEQFGRFIWLRDNTKPGDHVYEVYEPFINFPLQLRNPTPIGQVFPYGYTPREHVEAVITSLNERRPRYIVWDNSYNIPDEQRRPGDHTGPLAKFVAGNYVPTGPVYMIDGHPIQVWQLKAQ